MDLIVAATGLLGTEICRLLTAQGRPVRALVRSTSGAGKVAALEAMGATIVIGDLKDPASLDEACHGATSVCSTASSTLSRQAGDSIETVDRVGQLALIDAAACAGVGLRADLVSDCRHRLPIAVGEARRRGESLQNFIPA